MADHVKYHELSCPECGADLTKPDAVMVEVSHGSMSGEFSTRLDSEGRLVDADEQVAAGYHAGSYCNECNELLDELDGPVGEDDNG